MVRITLPNRLKSYTGGSNSASHSRSTSPIPTMRNNKGGGGDYSPEFAKGLTLKVVVMKVGWQKDLDKCTKRFHEGTY